MTKTSVSIDQARQFLSKGALLHSRKACRCFNLCICVSFPDNESPVTSPREKEFQFGGYSPSIGGSTPTDGRGRPTTAPNRRAVRFADELGLDDNDFLSSSDNRPRSAPNNPRSRPGATKRLNKSFSFDEDESNNSAANKNEKAKPLVNKPVERVKSPEAQETKGVFLFY